MGGPAVKREAVAHLQAVTGLSERRACSIVDADRKIIRYRSGRARTPNCEAGCAISPTNADDLAIAGCSFCCDGTAIPRG